MLLFVVFQKLAADGSDDELILAATKETGKGVTVEEYSIIGSLRCTFGKSGSAAELIKKYELDTDSIYNKVNAFVK